MRIAGLFPARRRITTLTRCFFLSDSFLKTKLSRDAGVKIDRRTSGPFVYENLETSEKGIFACGNVLHVHDLVDYVTEESQAAGKAAAAFVLEGTLADSGHVVEIKTEPTVSYTVPRRCE